MTYTAPELLLVGATQNLVLGDSADLNITARCFTFEPGLEGPPYEDTDGW